jgi:hypothetical protein
VTTVTEAEWLACADPQPMLAFLRGKASDRKLRLFAVACARAVWDLLEDERCRHAVAVGERYADRQATEAELRAASETAWQAVDSCPAEANYAAQSTVETSPYDGAVDGARHAAQDDMPLKDQCALLRDIFGNPFRPAHTDPAWLAWNDGTVVKVAQGIYDERAFERLPILADALEGAGCDDADVLGHLRQECEHVRGCWPVDLILAKK